MKAVFGPIMRHQPFPGLFVATFKVEDSVFSRSTDGTIVVVRIPDSGGDWPFVFVLWYHHEGQNCEDSGALLEYSTDADGYDEEQLDELKQLVETTSELEDEWNKTPPGEFSGLFTIETVKMQMTQVKDFRVVCIRLPNEDEDYDHDIVAIYHEKTATAFYRGDMSLVEDMNDSPKFPLKEIIAVSDETFRHFDKLREDE